MPSWSPQKSEFGYQNVAKIDPQIFIIFPKILQKILTIPVFGPWCLLEASKTLPRACQEGPRRRTSPPEAPKSPQEDPVQQNETQEASDINQNFLNFAGHKCPNAEGAAVIAPWASSIIDSNKQ